MELSHNASDNRIYLLARNINHELAPIKRLLKDHKNHYSKRTAKGYNSLFTQVYKNKSNYRIVPLRIKIYSFSNQFMKTHQ